MVSDSVTGCGTCRDDQQSTFQSLPNNELASAFSYRESDVVALLNQVPFIGHPKSFACRNLDVRATCSGDDSSGIAVWLTCGKVSSQCATRLTPLTSHICKLSTISYFYELSIGIFHSPGTGAWQFIVGLPYASISAAATWQVLLLLHKSGEKDPDEICLSPLEIFNKLLRRNQRLSFSERLSHVPHSEIFFLMTALVDMADSPALAYIVAIEIFDITYLNMNLRSLLAKDGRDLLSSLAMKQPFVVSVLLDAIENHMLTLGAMSCYLMDAMPLELWHPDKEDLDIIAHFPPLLSSRLTSDLHQFVGVLLLESYKKFCADSVHKQARYLPFIASGTCKSSTPADFGNWVWNILFKLKLHAFDRNHHAQLSLVVDESLPMNMAPDLQEYKWLQPVAHATDELLPCGIFLSLSISRVGHCREQVFATGLKCISLH
ncbi:hypothetical protein MRX96_013430 [Rhipicephalus microplus]